MFIKHTDKEADKTIFAIKIGNAVQQMRYLTRALIYIYIYIYIYIVIFQHFFHSTIENFICKKDSKSKKFICVKFEFITLTVYPIPFFIIKSYCITVS